MSECSCIESVCSSAVKDIEPLAGVFKALGHPVRLMMVELLVQGERCVCELQSGSGRDMSTISSHLNVLKQHGVVTCEQRGKNVYYALACPCLETVFSCLKGAIAGR